MIFHQDFVVVCNLKPASECTSLYRYSGICLTLSATRPAVVATLL